MVSFGHDQSILTCSHSDVICLQVESGAYKHTGVPGCMPSAVQCLYRVGSQPDECLYDLQLVGFSPA